MAVTYTDNLHLGMQLDKTDYVNWDAITQNWQKIDAAVSGAFPQNSVIITNGLPESTPDVATDFEPVS